MKVTVVVTAHNYGRFLDQCIRSVLGQTLRDFEVIVVDDGSTDETAQVVARYAEDPRLSVRRLHGVGLASAANEGIRHSKGEYVMRLDADDYLDRHSLAVLAGYLDEHPGAAMVYPDYFMIREDGSFLGYTRTLDFTRAARGTGRLPLPGGSMWRKVCLEAVGGFDETLRYQEDYDLWLRFTARYEVGAVHLPLLYYRQHVHSMSRNLVSRSAARRHVKRIQAGRLADRNTWSGLIALPAEWPGDPARAQDWLTTPFGEATLLDYSLSQVRTRASGRDRVLVVGAEDALVRACAEREIAFAPWPEPDTGVPGWPPVLAFMRALMVASDSKHDYVALLSPYCPFRDCGRLDEAVDTLALHECDMVVSVDAEAARVWTDGEDGLREAGMPVTTGAGSGRIVREAGELVVARADMLREGRPLDRCRVGYVDLLGPEMLTVKDELSARMAADLLGGGLKERLVPGPFLRTPGGR